MSDNLQNLRQQLLQLKSLHAQGVLDAAAYEQSRAPLERRLVDLVLASPGAAAAPPGKAPAAPGATNAASRARPSSRLLAALGIFVVAVAGLGYWLTGSPDKVTAGAAAGTPEAAGSAPHAITFDQIAAMTDQLRDRLKDHPDDADGWSMLARSLSVLGRNDEAVPAYEKAAALRPDDAALLADYADALAVTKKGDLSGEPIKLIERALKNDGNNVKALALAGTEAFNRKDYKSALKYWEKAVKIGPADDPQVQQVEGGIVEARQLAGLPPAKGEADKAVLPGSADKAVAGGGGGSVSGTVTLDPSLASRASPDDTVFIYARPAEGPHMPLAVLRKQVKDLPVTFTLDDSMAMSPAAKLSGAGRIVVGARISKSGNAVPTPGDLDGQSAPVEVGAKGLNIRIAEVVKP